VVKKPQFMCRFGWRTGSIAVWDNRCTQHLPVDDYAGKRREMIRVTIGAEVPS
jgi:taurine dioxygenase